MNTRKTDFITSIADFLKIDLKNSITKEYLEVETGFIQDDWYLEFINHLGNTKTEFKRPLDIFTSAINSYKSIKFQHYYSQVGEKTKKLVNKLQDTFRVFENTTPPENITYKNFKDTNRESGEKTDTFDDKAVAVLESAGSWTYLYGRRNDTYGLIQMIEKAYKQNIEKKIKDTAIALGNAPQIGYQAKNLLSMVGV